jgi:hypothetical protein
MVTSITALRADVLFSTGARRLLPRSKAAMSVAVEAESIAARVLVTFIPGHIWQRLLQYWRNRSQHITVISSFQHYM